MTTTTQATRALGWASFPALVAALALSGAIASAIGCAATPAGAAAPAASNAASAPAAVALCCRALGERDGVAIDCQPLAPGGTLATCAAEPARKVFVQCHDVLCVDGNCKCAAFGSEGVYKLDADVGICCPEGGACRGVQAPEPDTFHRMCDGDGGPASGAKHIWCPSPECEYDAAAHTCACAAPLGSRSAVGQCCYGKSDGTTECSYEALSPAQADDFSCRPAITTDGYDGSVLTGVCQAGCTYALTRAGASESYTCSC